jgi:hypothetical protein
MTLMPNCVNLNQFTTYTSLTITVVCGRTGLTLGRVVQVGGQGSIDQRSGVNRSEVRGQ